MTSRALIVDAIVGQKGVGADGDVAIWRPTDGGVRWANPEPLNDVDSSPDVDGMGAPEQGVRALVASIRQCLATPFPPALRDASSNLGAAAGRPLPG
jgi:hypothetical protein